MALRSLWQRADAGRRALLGVVAVCPQSSSFHRLQQRLQQQQQVSKMATSLNCDELVVPKEEVIRFIADCMTKAGARHEDAEAVGHHLMTADYRGHFSHGMNRMQMYVDDIRHKLTDPAAKPKIVNDFQVRMNIIIYTYSCMYAVGERLLGCH